MSFAYDGGQQTHSRGAATRRDDAPPEWTPDERAAHAKNTASNVTRAAAEVAAACARMQAAIEPAAQAAAKKEAGLALESLRAAATAAAAALSQAADPEVVAVLKGASDQLEAADAEVKALPEPAAPSSAEAAGVRRFAAALPPADGPRPHDSPELVQRLKRIIDHELVHGDLDPLKAALAEGGELWPQVARLPEKLRQLLSERLAAVRPRLLTERIDREKAAKRRPAAAESADVAADGAAPAHDGSAAADAPVADVRDPVHALAATASAQLGIAPRLEVGEAGRAATEARGARGVAHGDAIAIHPDVDATTAAGKQVVLHEHLHQAQAQLPAEQDGGRDAAELEADELASAAANGGALTRPTRHIDLSRPAGDDDAKRARDQGPHSEAAEARVDAALAAAARDGQTVTSRVYLRGHLSERVLPAIARFLADKRYPLPERLRYVDSDRGVGAEAVRLITEVHGGDPFYALPQILERVGVDVWAIIDAHRKAPAPRTYGDVMAGAAPTDSTDLSAGKRGGPGWVDGIGTGIAEGFHRAVTESVARLGERYVAAYDSNGKDAAESHGLRQNLAVAYHHLRPVVAIDRVVARVMVDDLVRVDPAAKSAPAKDKPADEPTAAPPTVTSAAQRVAEDAGQVDMALALDRRGPGGLHMPPKEIHALRRSLGDLADTLHDHGRQDRDEVKELDVARAKVEAVQRQLAARYGARNAEVLSLAAAVGLVWAAARANQATDAPDTQDERDALASVARESLAMLEGARSMIEQAQGQVPGVYVFSKPIMPAITTTRQWVTDLAGGQDAAAATRLASAIRIQEQFVATVVAELTAVFGEPPTATWAATVNAYAEVLGQSSESPDHSALALERARRMRRRLKLDMAAAFIDGGNEAAGQVRDLDGKEGDAATAEQRALMARRDQYEEQIAAGGVVPQAALDDLALDAREQAFDHRLEVLDQMAKKVRGAAADLQELHVTRGLALWALQKKLLAGVVPRCDALVASLAEVERTTLAARTKAGKAASPDKGNARRTAAADAAEVQLKAALRDGHYQATLDEARSKLDDAQLVDTIAMLAELIAMTLVGNMAATATSGMARGMVIARASANAERAAAAMEAAGTARQLALAEQAGTMLRAEGLAARIGGAAGLAAEGVVNSLGQKLQGDDSSLASLIVVNIGTSAALERLVGALTTLRHAEQAGADAVAEVRKLRLAARKGGAMAKAAATLGAEVVMAAAVDHALSKMVGRASNPPSDQTVAEWLMQGAMMAVGKHMSRNVDAIAHSLEALDLKATGAGADIYARATGLARQSREMSAGKGAANGGDVLEHYIQLLSDQTRLLNQEMVEAVDHNDDKRRAQIVKALRDANRASGQVRDFAQDSIEGTTTDGTPDRPAAAQPDRVESDDRPARDDAAPSKRTQATRGEGADEEAPLPRTRPDRDPLSPEGLAENAAAIARGEPGYNEVVGYVPSQDAGLELMQRLMRGDPTALAEVGFHREGKFDPASREWGLGKLGNKYVLIAGEHSTVDWTVVEGVEPIGHSHPRDRFRVNAQGNRVLDVTTMTAKLDKTKNLDAALFFSSPADIAFLATRRVGRHDIALPYEHAGGSSVVLASATPSGRPPVTLVLENATFVGTQISDGAMRYRTKARLEANGEAFWHGTIDAVIPHGQDGHLEFDAPDVPVLRGGQPVPATARTHAATPPDGDNGEGPTRPVGSLPDGTSSPAERRPSGDVDRSTPAPSNDGALSAADRVEGWLGTIDPRRSARLRAAGHVDALGKAPAVIGFLVRPGEENTGPFEAWVANSKVSPADAIMALDHLLTQAPALTGDELNALARALRGDLRTPQSRPSSRAEFVDAVARLAGMPSYVNAPARAANDLRALVGDNVELPVALAELSRSSGDLSLGEATIAGSGALGPDISLSLGDGGRVGREMVATTPDVPANASTDSARAALENSLVNNLASKFVDYARPAVNATVREIAVQVRRSAHGYVFDSLLTPSFLDKVVERVHGVGSIRAAELQDTIARIVFYDSAGQPTYTWTRR
ncbi:MAG: hypothetical protein JNK64_13185 [Myxococcales bacterium]|nr:hypothetical protein [Myxococcales bacterium]